jgi:hypothetical protein
VRPEHLPQAGGREAEQLLLLRDDADQRRAVLGGRGPAQVVLRQSASLATRTLTMVDSSTGAPQSVIDNITPGAGTRLRPRGLGLPVGRQHP